MISEIEAGTLQVERDDRSSPTGFHFNIARLEGTIGVPEVADVWERSCDIGHLRTEVIVDGRPVYRCPAEPVKDFIRKGGKEADTVGRQCLCRQLAAAAGVEHHIRRDHEDAPIVTFGLHGPQQVREFLGWLRSKIALPFGEIPLEAYSARRVVEYLLQGAPRRTA